MVAIDGSTFAASQQRRAFLFAVFHVAKHGFHLLLADDCPQPCLRIQRIAQLNFLASFNQLGYEFIFYFLFNEQPRASGADFAFAVEDAIERALDGAIDRRIGEDDVG